MKYVCHFATIHRHVFKMYTNKDKLVRGQTNGFLWKYTFQNNTPLKVAIAKGSDCSGSLRGCNWWWKVCFESRLPSAVAFVWCVLVLLPPPRNEDTLHHRRIRNGNTSYIAHILDAIPSNRLTSGGWRGKSMHFTRIPADPDPLRAFRAGLGVLALERQ